MNKLPFYIWHPVIMSCKSSIAARSKKKKSQNNKRDYTCDTSLMAHDNNNWSFIIELLLALYITVWGRELHPALCKVTLQHSI